MTSCIRAVADCRCHENGHARHAFAVTNRLPADKTRSTLERRDAQERLHASPFRRQVLHQHTATLPDLTMRSPLIPLDGATHRYPFARSQRSSRVASQRPEPQLRCNCPGCPLLRPRWRRSEHCYRPELVQVFSRPAPARLVRSVEFHKADGFDPDCVCLAAPLPPVPGKTNARQYGFSYTRGRTSRSVVRSTNW